VASKSEARGPSWYGIPVRVLLVTFIGTLLSFSFSLLFGIAGISLYWALYRVHPNMAVAYRRIALPSAILGGSVILVLSLVTEIRRYRRSRALSAIERMN
jgi:hypothetical protein